MVLKMYNNSNIEQLGVCTVKLRYKDEDVKCGFFVVPDDGPRLLGKPGIELLGILRIICEVMDGQQNARKSQYFTHSVM